MTAQDAPKSTDRRRVGSVRRQYRAFVKDARGSRGFSPAEEVLASLGDSWARIVDSAESEAALERATGRLTAVMDRLERREEVPGDGAAGRDAGAELRLVMDSPPSVGDAAHV